MTFSDSRSGTRADRPPPPHREIVQLIVLILLAIGAFFLTRAIASSNRAMNLQHGVEWYEEGQRRLSSGDANGAIEAFRRATVRNRLEKRYTLALARVLASEGRNDVARTALLRLRDLAPEDTDINLQLARLAAERRDVAEALRYYHNTLYAPWPSARSAARRDVRRELVRFLMDEGRIGAARSELVALETELPEEAPEFVALGELYAEAGDNRRALDAFERALAMVPAHPDALAGAGRAAFEIDNYGLARRYLRAARANGRPVDETLDVAERVLSLDPLAARIGAAARRARFLDAFAGVRERLDGCLQAIPPAVASPRELVVLRTEALEFEARFADTAAQDSDVIAQGVDLLARMAAAVGSRCPPPTVADRALIRIGRLHGAETP